jgi:hypothetical protein
MTESGLAAEIFAIADLARQRALSIQHGLLLDAFREVGAADDEQQEFLAVVLEDDESPLELRSPQQSSRAQAEVFASRYSDSD